MGLRVRRVRGTTMTDKLMSLAKYVLVRGISAVITISLFGLFARRLIHNDLENALSFSLVFGFFGALTRTLASFAARIQSSYSLEERHSAVLTGYKSVLLAQGVLVPAFLVTAFGITASPLISLVAALILVVSSFDFDLSRAANAQEMLFPPLFLFGSIVALAYFSLHPFPTQHTAFIATLIQWVPVALYSVYRLLRVGLCRIGQAAVTINHVFSSLLIVSFDGIILNLPMMPFIPTSEDIRIEVAVLLRNFISSLFLLPFLIYLTNKITSRESDRGLRYQKWIFFAGIFGSSLLAFFVYIVFFGIISGTPATPSSFQAVAPLALGFAAYYANARYLKSASQGSVPLAASMFLIAIGNTATLIFTSPSAAQILLLQAVSFIALTATMLAIGYLNERPEAKT